MQQKYLSNVKVKTDVQCRASELNQNTLQIFLKSFCLPSGQKRKCYLPISIGYANAKKRSISVLHYGL